MNHRTIISYILTAFAYLLLSSASSCGNSSSNNDLPVPIMDNVYIRSGDITGIPSYFNDVLCQPFGITTFFPWYDALIINEYLVFITVETTDGTPSMIEKYLYCSYFSTTLTGYEMDANGLLEI